MSTAHVKEVATKDGNLILDSHKLSHHMDVVEAWEAGERIAPVSVDMALTRACGAMCSFCYAMVQEPQERSSIKVDSALALLDDFKAIGVKSVSLISDGESTISKAYVPFVQHAAELGIDVGNATNAKTPMITPTPITQQGAIRALSEEHKNVIEKWVGDMKSNMLGLQPRSRNIHDKIDERQLSSGVFESTPNSPLSMQSRLQQTTDAKGSMVHISSTTPDDSDTESESSKKPTLPENTIIQIMHQESNVGSGTNKKSRGME